VADGGANDVLLVTPDGEVSTFFVPPVVTTGPWEGQQNNDPEHAGCDPVPTGVTVGPDGRIYVSTLSAEAPGEGIVYILDETGAVLDKIDGLDAPSGVALDDDGNVYVSDPSSSGRLIVAGADLAGPTLDANRSGRLDRWNRASPNRSRASARSRS
jgi:sugar lactone lactonase YvrE